MAGYIPETIRTSISTERRDRDQGYRHQTVLTVTAGQFSPSPNGDNGKSPSPNGNNGDVRGRSPSPNGDNSKVTLPAIDSVY
jgi:hypothetical protein